MTTARGKSTYCNTRRYQIAFIQYKYQVLVGCFLANVLFDASTSRTFWVSCIQNMYDNIRGVNDFVELIPYSLAFSFRKDGFSGRCQLSILLGLLNLRVRLAT